MRVTRPTMNVSSIASPTTRMWAPAKPDTRRAPRSGASGGTGMVAARRCERQRDEHEEQHQEFGVAEVVLEESGRQHRGDGGEAGGGWDPVGLRTKHPD